jgi:uncharacterized protein YodC (DUF2158 family)
MAEALKIGDKVRLKSGGPVMTIGGIGINTARRTDLNYWRCDWFDRDHNPHTEHYHKDSLELATDTPLMA